MKAITDVSKLTPQYGQSLCSVQGNYEWYAEIEKIK